MTITAGIRYRVNLCKDCVHAMDSDDHEDLVCARVVDVVIGQPVSCTGARADSRLCGPIGAFFTKDFAHEDSVCSPIVPRET